MKQILSKNVEIDKFELIIDTKIFDKKVILNSAYNFLDK
jgi:hypothetical protein